MKNPGPKAHSPAPKTPHRQSGSSLLEVMGALAIGTGVMVGVADQTDRYLDNTRAVKAAEYHRATAQAALKYLQGQQTIAISQGEVVLRRWKDVSDAVPAAKDLKEVNPYGEKSCVLLRKDGTEVVGLLIVAGEASDKAETIQRRALVQNLGGLAMGVRDGAKLRGANWEETGGFANWKLNDQDCGGKKLLEGGLVINLKLLDLIGEGLKGADGQNPPKDMFLHRKLQKDEPWLNAMETTLTMSGTNSNIDMNGNDLKDVGTISFLGTVRRIEKLLGINLVSKETVRFGGGVKADGDLTADGDISAASATVRGDIFMPAGNSAIHGLERITAPGANGATMVTFDSPGRVVQINAGLQADEYLKITKTKKKNDPCDAPEKYRYVRDADSSGLLYCNGTNWVSTQDEIPKLKARYVDSGDTDGIPGYDYMTVFCAPGEIAISGGGTSYGGKRYQETITGRGGEITRCNPRTDNLNSCYGIRPGIDGGHPVWDKGRKLMGWAISGTLPGREDNPRDDEIGNKLRVYAICVKGEASHVTGRADVNFDVKSNMEGWKE